MSALKYNYGIDPLSIEEFKETEDFLLDIIKTKKAKICLLADNARIFFNNMFKISL